MRGDQIVGIIIFVIMAWLLLRSHMRTRDPLKHSPDDPLMLEAIAKARASVDEFKNLLKEPHEDALVKVRFISSSEQAEHLWADVLDVSVENELRVRLVTPPVTHTGDLDRLQKYSFDDIEDWHIRDQAGRIHGAFTERAMFAIARRDGVKLSKKLLQREQEYK